MTDVNDPSKTKGTLPCNPLNSNLLALIGLLKMYIVFTNILELPELLENQDFLIISKLGSLSNLTPGSVTYVPTYVTFSQELTYS